MSEEAKVREEDEGEDQLTPLGASRLVCCFIVANEEND